MKIETFNGHHLKRNFSSSPLLAGKNQNMTSQNKEYLASYKVLCVALLISKFFQACFAQNAKSGG